MAKERLPMRKIREILRSRFDGNLSPRQTAHALGVSRGAVLRCLKRFHLSGLPYPLPGEITDKELERTLYPSQATVSSNGGETLPREKLEHVHKEMHRKGVTLKLLWEEYRMENPEGLGYSWFCEQYDRYRQHLDIPFHHHYKGGEMSFVDYSGDSLSVVDRETGESRKVELFVIVWAASNYTYWEFTEQQTSLDWQGSHLRAFSYFGRVPRVVVPDNLKSGVNKTCRYEPLLNYSYERLADHFGFTIFPARSRKAKDKAKAEGHVLIAQRWLLGRLRDRTFFSLAELNAAARSLLEGLQDTVMKDYGGSRRQLFEELDKHGALPLPNAPYEPGLWTHPVRLGIDYHFKAEGNFYSAPYTFRGELLAVKFSQHLVEAYLGGERIASHRRLFGKGRYSTQKEHMPESHRKYVEWNAGRVLNWAAKVGKETHALAEALLSQRRYPQQAYRSILGVIRLEKHYGKERLNSACALALRHDCLSYREIADILKKGWDQRPMGGEARSRHTLPPHENIRGRGYYQTALWENTDDTFSNTGEDAQHEASAHGGES